MQYNTNTTQYHTNAIRHKHSTIQYNYNENTNAIQHNAIQDNTTAMQYNTMQLTRCKLQNTIKLRCNTTIQRNTTNTNAIQYKYTTIQNAQYNTIHYSTTSNAIQNKTKYNAIETPCNRIGTTMQCSTNTIQYKRKCNCKCNTTRNKCNTMPYSTIQYNTMQYNANIM